MRENGFPPGAAFTLSERFVYNRFISPAHAKCVPAPSRSVRELVDEGRLQQTPTTRPAQCERALTPLPSTSKRNNSSREHHTPVRHHTPERGSGLMTHDASPAFSFGRSLTKSRRQFISRQHLVDALGHDSPGPQYAPVIQAVRHRSPAFTFNREKLPRAEKIPGSCSSSVCGGERSNKTGGQRSASSSTTVVVPTATTYSPQYHLVHRSLGSCTRWPTSKTSSKTKSTFRQHIEMMLNSEEEKGLDQTNSRQIDASEKTRSRVKANGIAGASDAQVPSISTTDTGSHHFVLGGDTHPFASSLSAPSKANSGGSNSFIGTTGKDSPGPMYYPKVSTFGKGGRSFAFRDPIFERGMLNGNVHPRATHLSHRAQLKESYGMHSPGPGHYAPRSNSWTSARMNKEPSCRAFLAMRSVSPEKKQDAPKKHTHGHSIQDSNGQNDPRTASLKTIRKQRSGSVKDSQCNKTSHMNTSHRSYSRAGAEAPPRKKKQTYGLRSLYDADRNYFISNAHNTCRLGRGTSFDIQHASVNASIFGRALSTHTSPPAWSFGANTTSSPNVSRRQQGSETSSFRSSSRGPYFRE